MKRYILKKDLLDIPAGTKCSQAPITGAIYTEIDRRLICQKEYLEENKDDFNNWFEELPEEINWEDNAIRSELAKVLIAPVDYAEGGKKCFTWEEACALRKKLSNGWRLPTRHEWAIIVEEFGVDENGRPSVDKLEKNLGLAKNGVIRDGDGARSAANYGYYWSSTPYSDGSYAYNLYFYSTASVYPSYSSSRQNGFSVRLVKDLEEA